MPFFNKVSYILVLKYKSIDIIDVYANKTTTINFLGEILNHLEVKDPAVFEKLLVEYLTKLVLKKGNTVILLSDEILFTSNDSEVDRFIDSIPFNPEDLVVKSAIINKNRFNFAANKSYYQLVYNMFEELNFKVVATLPQLLFSNDIVSASKNYNKYKVLNFNPIKEGFWAKMFSNWI